MSRYRGRRSGGSSRLIPFIIALLVAIAAIVLVIINVTQDKTPADDVADDTQQGDVPPDDTLGDEGDDTAVEDEPQHVVIEVQGDEERYDAVYRVGDTGYEMYTYVESTAKKYADNINAIADAVEGTATVYMLPAPLSSGITLPDALYGKDIFSDQKAAEDSIIGFMNDKVVSVPLNKAMMAHRGEYIYFRTDHHWTATGAYYAYAEFCKAAGKTPTPLESYETEEFPGFLGTFYRDTNESSHLGDNPDTVVAYHPLSADATLDYTDKNGQVIRWPIIYDQSSAPASYKYGTFVGGDQPYISSVNSPTRISSIKMPLSCISIPLRAQPIFTGTTFSRNSFSTATGSRTNCSSASTAMPMRMMSAGQNISLISIAKCSTVCRNSTVTMKALCGRDWKNFPRKTATPSARHSATQSREIF